MGIRPVCKKDIRALTDIYNYYILNTTVTLEEKPLNAEKFELRVNIISNKYPYIVYVDENDSVLGFAYFDTFNPRSAYARTADLSIYVDKKYLHKHIGSEMFDYLCNIAKDYNIDTIISIITSENENSVRFHLKKGFVQAGYLKDVAFKFKRDISVSFFEKKL